MDTIATKAVYEISNCYDIWVRKTRRLTSHRPNLAILLIAFGLVLAATAAAMAFYDHKTSPKPPSEASISSSVASSVKPSPQAVANYSVPPKDPKYIAIPSIGISSTPILNLGLASNGAIATPDNIYETGWYDKSSQPGQPGAIFIYGHVSNWSANGIFYNLKSLKPGDDITITRGDSTTYVYRVATSKVYPYNAVDMNTVLSPIDKTKPGLNLMTCTGQVMKGTSDFNERLVVFASLVRS